MSRIFLKAWIKNNVQGIRTIEELADRLGVSRQHLSTIINGDNMSTELAVELSKITGYTLDEIILGDEKLAENKEQ